jgi:hypothetical protein
VALVDGGLDLRRRAAGGSSWRLLDSGGRSVRGDQRGGDDQRSLAVGLGAGRRPVLGMAQVWSEEDRCGLASRRLSAVAAQLQ